LLRRAVRGAVRSGGVRAAGSPRQRLCSTELHRYRKHNSELSWSARRGALISVKSWIL
jgi:hypothetical protein